MQRKGRDVSSVLLIGSSAAYGPDSAMASESSRVFWRWTGFSTKAFVTYLAVMLLEAVLLWNVVQAWRFGGRCKMHGVIIIRSNRES